MLAMYETGRRVWVSAWGSTNTFLRLSLIPVVSQVHCSMRVSDQVSFAPMSLIPAPISKGPATHTTPTSLPTPCPNELPNLEYAIVRSRSGETGLFPLKMVSAVVNPAGPCADV